MKLKLTILVLLLSLLSLVGRNKAFSQCSYISTNMQGVTTTIRTPCDFPVLEAISIPFQDTLTYQNSVKRWNNLHPTLTFVSVLPEPVATSTYIEIPAPVFVSFSVDRQAAMQRFSYYYKVKP